MKPPTTGTAFLLLASIFILSCNDSQPRSYVEYYHPKPSLIFAGDVSNSGQRNPPHGKPGHRCDLPEGALLPSNETFSIPASATTAFTKAQHDLQQSSNNPTAPGAEASAAGLNPAHGQPGHRCNIPVGAPLNSVPANTNLANNTGAAHSKTTAASAGSPKLNPSHGQPGHRCDIAVGAPLNTPSVLNSKTNAPPVVANRPVMGSAQVPSVNPPDSSTGTVRLNPPHGQPGHDCTIAVGKPLKQ